jgi:hypothetical protein
MRFARGAVKGHIDVLKPSTKVTNIHGHVGGAWLLRLSSHLGH